MYSFRFRMRSRGVRVEYLAASTISRVWGDRIHVRNAVRVQAILFPALIRQKVSWLLMRTPETVQ
jgi:hypothetical protein